MARERSTMDTVKSYVLQEFLPGEDPGKLTPTTPLMSSGILDSIASLKLVMFLEKEFNIELEAHEADVENLNTLRRSAIWSSRKRERRRCYGLGGYRSTGAGGGSDRDSRRGRTV